MLRAALLASLSLAALAQSPDLLPPTAPANLTATVSSCGQVELTWSASVDEPGGSGLKAYTITRVDQDSGGSVISIGAARTSFSDTNYVRASRTMTYSVTAIDHAGNRSLPGNPVSVTTPPCPVSPGEIVFDRADMAPLGKVMATFGARTVVLFVKTNPVNLTRDTWIAVHDADAGRTSTFLLHPSPGYNQIETDYVLTSLTELWTISHTDTLGGNVVVSQYRLNGSPPSSATLLSSLPLGDSRSKAKSMIRLNSGALLAAWSQEGWGQTGFDLTAGFAYRAPGGQWKIKSPVIIPNSGGGTILMSQWAMAQHPADGAVWAFVKRDSFHQISALLLRELPGDIAVESISPAFISVSADGNNGPEGEYPFLAAVPDPTRGAILLAYQRYDDRIIFIDPLFGSMNSIFLKDAPINIAAIRSDGTRSFLPAPVSAERCSQFGLSVLPDGALWLAYQPVNASTLTWNEVYASRYENGAWSAPVLAGRNYRTYNVASGARDPGLLVFHAAQPQVAFLTPDEKIRAFNLALSAQPPDSVPPVASILSPSNGASVSGTVSVNASASDNVAVTQVDFFVDGVLKDSRRSAPYTFSWDSSTSPPGPRTLRAVAYDAAGNAGASGPVTVTVLAPAPSDSTAPSVSITSPANGSLVQRNKTLTISAAASDNVGVARVEFYAAGALLGADSTAPYSWDWKVPAKTNVSYVLKAVAYDQAGNAAAATVTVTAK
jgi:hypothetical protein